MSLKDDVNSPLSPLVSSDGQALSPLEKDQLLKVLHTKKKAKKFKKGGGSRNKKSSLFRCSVAIHGKISSIDSPNLDPVDPERDPFIELGWEVAMLFI